jgi:hypothetical protein
MIASQVRIADLTDWTACLEARDGILSDYRNCAGGISAWNSGLETVLTSAAQRKHDAIERKMDKLMDTEEDF